jgi:hypothetical protein
MKKKLSDWLADAYASNRGVVAIIGAFIMGITVAMAGGGYINRLEAVETMAQATVTKLDRLEGLVEDLTVSVCLLTKLQANDNVLDCRVNQK